uniref:Unc-13 D n=1 Tax=Daphnia magna TaxID=35525 RepID=A0A0N8EGD3_9CRUS
MSCSARVKKCGGRRVDNNNSNNNNRRSLLFLLGSDGGGMSNNSASAWFHNSLQHLSHSWHRFNKFGISRDKKADRCSTWFVDQTDNNNKTLPFFSFPRRTISEESIDFFDRFSKISEGANTQRIPAGRRGAQLREDDTVEEAFARANRINKLDHQRITSSPQLSDGSDEGADRVESAPLPAPRSRPRSRVPTPTVLVAWIWGPELIVGHEAEIVYCEVLYSLLHAISRTGCDNSSIDQVFDYLKRSFQFTDAKHEELLSTVRHRTPPDVSLQLGVLQARNLKGKDVNGMSDPYCSIWISSNRQKFQDTSMKPRTLDPVWNETLNFAVKDVNEDILQLEIWDYDPDETVKEKMSRITEVKDLRGMGILLKQIAVASKAPGKPAHKFLGLLNLGLKSIPLSGLERWYQLEGRDKTKTKDRGEIRLNLTLSASRPDTSEQFTLQESFIHYERLLRIVVEHEMRGDSEWRGVIPDSAALMLRQFAAHRGLRQSVTDACLWSVYSTAFHKRTLDLSVMLGLVQRLRKAINDGKLPEEELVNVFWTAAESFSVAALSAIRHLRNNPELSTRPDQLSALLECLKELNMLGSNRPGLSEMEVRISESVTMGAADWFCRVVGGRRKGGPICDDDRLENAIRICQSLMTDLKTVLTVHHKIFERIWQIPVFNIVYLYYDGQLTDISKPVVDSVTRSLKSVHTNNNQIVSLALEASGEVSRPVQNGHAKQNEADAIAPRLSMGTALFELYLCLQQFHKLSISLPQSEKESVKLAPFYTWFETAVDRWLDIALYKAMIRIGKAVSLDNLQTVDSIVRHSSSAVDAVSVFYSIKMFWEQLAWPDEKGALSFVIKIMDEVKQSATIYAEAIRLKLERLHSGSPTSATAQPFFISLKICSAINSILHVQLSIDPLAEEIGLYRLRDAVQQNGDDGSIHLGQEALTENAIKDVNEKLDEIFYAIARRFEVEVAKLINTVMESDFGMRQTDDLNHYICNQLLALDSNLPRDVFFRVLNIIYHHILQSFLNVVEGEVQKKRQPACFRQWKELLDIVENCFQNPDAEEEIEDEALVKIRWLLKLHGMDTGDLIHQYRLDRLKQTLDSGKDAGIGSLSVRVIFIDDALNIDILNARNLKPMDVNGSADPYVKVQLLPTTTFPDAAILKSKVLKNTLFPLFEESFTYPVPKSLQTNPECCILFTVKDKDLIGANEMMGEYFLGFQEITRGDSSVDMNALDQRILPLTKPQDQESEYLNALEGRTWDKVARDFAKKEKKRMNGK